MHPTHPITEEEVQEAIQDPRYYGPVADGNPNSAGRDAPPAPSPDIDATGAESPPLAPASRERSTSQRIDTRADSNPDGAMSRDDNPDSTADGR